MKFVNINFEQFEQTPMGGFYRKVNAQPSWVTRLALFAAILIVVVPIMVMTLAAMIAFGVVFLLGAGVHRVNTFFRGLFSGGSSGDTMRRNVRVVRHDP